MRVAIVHDYIKEYGGAEKVLEKLHELWPDAPVYTLVYLPEFLGPHRKRFADWDIRTSVLQHIPFKHKLISPFRILAPFIFRSFNLSSYDVIIVSQTGAYFPNLVRKNPSIKLICYTHTPPRYLYGYKTAREWKNNIIFLILGEIANHFLRMVDFYASKNVDYFIANSEEVKARIKKFYRKEATVIYPPATVENPKSEIRNPKQIQNSKLRNTKLLKTKDQRPKTEYYLTGGRLARAKGIDIVIEAFNKLEKPLKVFGKGFAGFEEELKKTAGDNIEFTGEVTEQEKFELMSRARAFVFASYDEDFGITPVEAMSVGTPVIAYKSGGIKETVIDGKTGILYHLNDLNHLTEAVKRFERTKINPEDCVKQAQKFSEEEFKRKMNTFVKNLKSQSK